MVLGIRVTHRNRIVRPNSVCLPCLFTEWRWAQASKSGSLLKVVIKSPDHGYNCCRSSLFPRCRLRDQRRYSHNSTSFFFSIFEDSWFTLMKKCGVLRPNDPVAPPAKNMVIYRKQPFRNFPRLECVLMHTESFVCSLGITLLWLPGSHGIKY